MHKYFIKTPWIIKRLYSCYTWDIPNAQHDVFLTFDDGPHPEITPWVLEELKKYDAKATFFCIGKNVVQYPDVYRRIQAEGHAIGNHTHRHLNGWKVSMDIYIQDIGEAARHISSSLFRPPYGRMRRRHLSHLEKAIGKEVKVIMWDVLSGDFDATFSPEQCARHVLDHVKPGSIVVFHDSEKAFTNLRYALPVVLEELSKRKAVLKAVEV